MDKTEFYFAECSCQGFIDALGSAQPVPGGGGAAAYVGAIGVALGNMVACLTIGKKKYADVEEKMIGWREDAIHLQNRLMAFVDEDAKAFEPLSRAYGIKAETDEEKAKKQEILENALRVASNAPMHLMETCAEAISLIEDFATEGSKLALSDAGVAALFCKSALQAAALNVFANTRLMKDREYAAKEEEKALSLMAEYTEFADRIYGDVLSFMMKAK